MLPTRSPGTGPEITITGIANFSGTTAAGDRFGEKIPSFSDNFTKIQGAHTIKAGFGLQMNNDNQIGDIFSQYTFSEHRQLPGRQERNKSVRVFHFSDRAGGAWGVVQVVLLRFLRAG